MINENRFSVLSIPDTLNFYLNDEDGCKQEIKIYNVHDFTINFKVLCTNVDNYSVDPPHGSIRSGCMINIHIQLKNHDFDRKKDVFKIDACSKENDKIIGEKEIIAHISPDKPNDKQNELKNRKKEELKETKSDDINLNNNKNSSNQTIQIDSQNLVIISTTRFCITILIVFIIGILTGMILNTPQDNQINLE